MWATGRESFGIGAAGDYGGGGGAGGGGGFVAGAGNEPGTAGGEKKFRGKNIAAVTIRQLLECTEDTLKIEDIEIVTVTVLGLVKHVEATSTRVSFIIDDGTGVIEAVQHIGAEDGVVDTATMLNEGTYGRVVGLLRTPRGAAGGKKYLVIYKAIPVTDLNELTVHLLEVLHIRTKLKQLKAGQDAKMNGFGAGMGNAIPSALMGASFGSGDATLGGIDLGRVSAGGPGGNMNNGFTPQQNMILNILKSCHNESGLHKSEIMQNVKNKMSTKEVETVLEYLSGEGHIFSTVDDDHFKVTDW